MHLTSSEEEGSQPLVLAEATCALPPGSARRTVRWHLFAFHVPPFLHLCNSVPRQQLKEVFHLGRDWDVESDKRVVWLSFASQLHNLSLDFSHLTNLG